MYKIVETFSNGDSNELATFTIENEAKEFFNNQLQENASKPEDFESIELELQKIVDSDISTIKSQYLYNEGTIDRKNHNGETPLYYGFKSTWNAKAQQLEYTFFFLGKKEKETVLESELKNWYY